MNQPWCATVSIGDIKFQAISSSVDFSTKVDHSGLPVMGSLQTLVEVVVDIHDEKNVPFGALKSLFELANVVDRSKIKPIKIELWKDDKHEDAICTYGFKGWISHWHTSSSGDGGNNSLYLTIQPAMDIQNFPEIKLTN